MSAPARVQLIRIVDDRHHQHLHRRRRDRSGRSGNCSGLTCRAVIPRPAQPERHMTPLAPPQRTADRARTSPLPQRQAPPSRRVCPDLATPPPEKASQAASARRIASACNARSPAFPPSIRATTVTGPPASAATSPNRLSTADRPQPAGTPSRTTCDPTPSSRTHRSHRAVLGPPNDATTSTTCAKNTILPFKATGNDNAIWTDGRNSQRTPHAIRTSRPRPVDQPTSQILP